jgi:hypothetical protein
MRWSRKGWVFWTRSLLTSRSMLNTKDDIEELDDRTLCIAPAAELHIGLLASAVIEHNAVRKPSVSHILATSEERSDAVIKDVWIATLVHAL